MQTRVFREEGGKFTIVLTPRKRYGLVPLTIKGLDKAGVSRETLAYGEREEEVRAVVRAARDQILRP